MIDARLHGDDESRLGKYLVNAGHLSDLDLERAAVARLEMGGTLASVLVSLGLVAESDLAKAISQTQGLPLARLDELPLVQPDVSGLQPDFVALHRIFPMYVEDNAFHVAMANPTDSYLKKALQLATGLAIRPYVASPGDIEAARARAQARVADDDDPPGISSPLRDAGDFVEHLKDLASEAPVIKLVSQIIGRVVDLRASDIHLEPFDDGLHVRYRVDGVLQMTEIVPSHHSAAVSSRVKLLAHLDIAERRLPQDGRVRTRVKGRELDLRVSTVPTVHGESVVLRVLDRASIRFSLDGMGFDGQTLSKFNGLLARPHGILLVTGPTGSGKTTTLYAALSGMDANSQKIVTVEDPVEYQLSGVNQIQVHPQIGLSFATALRSILRQDPDIIMIGEMRDGETAQIAVQSALTGHLVLSTLHTNTAASAVMRMQDMGVEKYLIASALVGVLAQRLVRSLCTVCKEPVRVTQEILSALNDPPGWATGQSVYQAVGCPACRGTGYLGRTGIHELLVVDEHVRKAMLAGGDSASLQRIAVERGMKTLYLDGLHKVSAGVTSLDELLRVTQDQSDD